MGQILTKQNFNNESHFFWEGKKITERFLHLVRPWWDIHGSNACLTKTKPKKILGSSVSDKWNALQPNNNFLFVPFCPLLLGSKATSLATNFNRKPFSVLMSEYHNISRLFDNLNLIELWKQCFNNLSIARFHKWEYTQIKWNTKMIEVKNKR